VPLIRVVICFHYLRFGGHSHARIGHEDKSLLGHLQSGIIFESIEQFVGNM
jgi:hypothetical protein